MSAIAIHTKKLKSLITFYINEYYTSPKRINTNVDGTYVQSIRSIIEENAKDFFIQAEIKTLNKITISSSSSIESCLEKPFVVEHKIGEGVYGKVFKVKDTGYAVKIIPIQNLFFTIDTKNSLKDKILQEIEISILAGKLNIGPKIHKFYICQLGSKKEAYLVLMMEYIDGKTLKQYLTDKNENITNEEKQFIIDKIKTKMDLLHDNKVIHWDIHSDNIMLSFSKNKIKDVFIIDYGNSKRIDTYIHSQLNQDNNSIKYLFESGTRDINGKNLIDYIILRMIEDKAIVIKQDSV